MMNRVRASASREDGFVLIGVIMFVLALTILGLSLFSLSGYEAQFLDASYERSQAFYDAMSGIDRAKFALSATNELSTVDPGPMPGFESVQKVEAWQKDKNTGRVDWDPDYPIRIVVTVDRNGERRIVTGTYIPTPNRTLYRSVFEVQGKVFVQDEDDQHTVHVNGIIRQNDTDFESWQWKFGQLPQNGMPGYSTGTFGPPGVPEPEVEDFISAWLPRSAGPPAFTTPNPNNSYAHRYDFDLTQNATGGDAKGKPYKVYSGPFGVEGDDPTAQNPDFRWSDAWKHPINVNIKGAGTVIWLFPGGAHFEQGIELSGYSGANLVMVATPSASAAYSEYVGGDRVGFLFGGSITSPNNQNLFIVSDGTVVFERRTNYAPTAQQHIQFLSVFAKGVYIRNPSKDSRYPYQIDHYATLDSEVLTPLYDSGLLPNTLGRTKTFALVKGSFNDSTTSIPF
jgi:hypothetical protein